MKLRTLKFAVIARGYEMSNPARNMLAMTLVIATGIPVFASSRIPRAAALAEIEHTAEFVRSTMNSDPQSMRIVLDDGLMDSAGDDPRAIALCKEVIEKSTNPVSVAIATGALYRSYQLLGFGPVHQEWHWFTSSKRMEEIAGILREAWRNPDLNVKLVAVGSLSGMGGRYREEGYRDFQELLRSGANQNSIYEHMINYFPTDVGVLHFYDERISNSASPTDSLRAIQEVTDVAIWNRSWFGGGEKKWAAVFRNALNHRVAAVQLTAALSLSRMGGSYSREARAFLERRLRQPLGEDPDNTAKTAVIRTILPLVDSRRHEDIRLVKDATKANPQVLGYFEEGKENNWISDRPLNREVLKQKWKAIVER